MDTKEQTAIIDRGVRLQQLRQLPGYGDLYRISESLTKLADDACIDFGGWDPLQIATLKARAHAAREFHATLWKLAAEAIEDARKAEREVTEAEMAARTPEQTVADADELRKDTLEVFEKMDVGSYGNEF
jgi:hypothetical protein